MQSQEDCCPTTADAEAPPDPPLTHLVGTNDYAFYTLFTAGASNELKFLTSGSGGLDELEEEFSDGKVMWAFVRVKDPGASTALVSPKWS